MEQGGQVGDLASRFADPETWVSVAFVIFVLLFGRKLWAALTDILDRRAETVRTELEEAARLKQEAETMLAEATSQRDAAIAEARTLLESAHVEAERLAAHAHHEAETAAARRERMAMDRITSAQNAALAEVRNAAAVIASRAAADVIRASMTPEGHARLIDQAIAALPVSFTRRKAA